MQRKIYLIVLFFNLAASSHGMQQQYMHGKIVRPTARRAESPGLSYLQQLERLCSDTRQISPPRTPPNVAQEFPVELNLALFKLYCWKAQGCPPRAYPLDTLPLNSSPLATPPPEEEESRIALESPSPSAILQVEI